MRERYRRQKVIQGSWHSRDGSTESFGEAMRTLKTQNAAVEGRSGQSHGALVVEQWNEVGGFLPGSEVRYWDSSKSSTSSLRKQEVPRMSEATREESCFRTRTRLLALYASPPVPTPSFNVSVRNVVQEILCSKIEAMRLARAAKIGRYTS